MGLRRVISAKLGGGHDAAASTHETQNLQDPTFELPIRSPMTRIRRWQQFLNPIAWLLLLCIGGPILLHELAIKYLDGSSSPIDNDMFYLRPLWTSWSTLFEINLRTGNLSFTAAKLIDIAFDIVVGRGGQFLLAWMAYRVYTDVLMRIAEKGQIRYDLFAAVTLRPNYLRTLGTATASVVSARDSSTRLALVWTVLAMLYVLGYPTLVSAATSLVAATTSSIQLNDNGTASFDTYIASAAYSFAHSGLENIPDPWIVPIANITDMSFNMCNIMWLSHHERSKTEGNGIIVNHTSYTLSNNTQTDCGFYYDNNFYNLHLAPATDEGQAFVDQFLADRTICLPDGRHYQWGASWELLLIIFILQSVWSASLLLMWLEATMHSRLVRKGRKMGKWRAVLDLTEPLRSRLGTSDGMYNQTQLAASVWKMPPVHYEAKDDGIQDGGYGQDVYLVSGFDAANSSKHTFDSEVRQLGGDR
ncbi:hypothetical protein N431DRAFT_445229 [Stipitochalara longipes BDJ]|nr:hypothetical protein N431DRAFT_445229 [Stipitochalara longipes BDJ]